MNLVRISYVIERDVAGFVRLSIERSGAGDDKVEQFADNLEEAIRRPARAAGYDIPPAERLDETEPQ